MQAHILVVLAALVAILPLGAARAQVQAPSLGGEVSFKLVTTTTMELSFGTRGTGQGRVVAVAAIPDGVPVPLAATDGTFYSANPVYGQGSLLGKGFAVYCGTGHSVTVSGLKPGTKYYIASSEFNTDSVNILYNIRGTSVATSTLTTSATALATASITDRRIEVYPNPSTSQAVSLGVQGYANEPLTMRLTDSLGRAVWEQALTPTVADYQAPLSLPVNLATGTYFLILSSSSGQLQKRLTILE